MEYNDLIYKKENHTAWISLNRPDVLNALSPGLVMELNKAIKEASEDEEIRVVVLTGEGRAFSAGVDLKEMNKSIQGGKFTQAEIIESGREMFEVIETMPKVAIAMVNGFCFTGALELILPFDIIIAAEEAKLGDTHAKWGILPKWGMTQRLPQKVGILKAREMSFTAQTVSGKEAERIGLVNRAVPLDQLKQTVQEMADTIANNSAQTIGAMKTLYYEGAHTTLKEGLEIEAAFDTTISDRDEVLRGFGKS